MSLHYLVIALAYAGIGVATWTFEWHRTRRSGADPITIFTIIALLQLVVAGVGIYGLLPFADRGEPTGNAFFDRVFQTMSPWSAWLVLGLTAWFLLAFYGGAALGGLAVDSSWHRGGTTDRPVTVLHPRLLPFLLGGALLALWSFQALGDGLIDRYANLVLYRNLSESVARNALNATTFALTQSWSWLAVIGAVCAFADRRAWWLRLAYFLLAVLFALLGVSRRSLFLPVLLAYLMVALRSNRWRLGWVAIGVLPLLFWLAFGKELLGAIAFNVPLEGVARSYDSWIGGGLRAASEVGISVVESVGTVQLVHLGPRLGVDHLLSVAQRFPEGMLGIDIDWPERIVRTTTTIFVDADALDIPPGMPGQMWLDAGVFGPMMWGLVLGLQMALVQGWWRRVRHDATSAAVAVMLVFIVALPVNTGSYDFTFSIEIIVFLAALWACIRQRPVPLPGGPG